MWVCVVQAFAAKQRRIGHVELKRLACQVRDDEQMRWTRKTQRSCVFPCVCRVAFWVAEGNTTQTRHSDIAASCIGGCLSSCSLSLSLSCVCVCVCRYLSLYLLHHNIPFQTTIHPHESDDDSGSRPTPSSVAGRVLTAPDGQPTKLPMIVLDVSVTYPLDDAYTHGDGPVDVFVCAQGVPFFGLVPTARYLARRVGDYGNDSQLDWRTDTVVRKQQTTQHNTTRS